MLSPLLITFAILLSSLSTTSHAAGNRNNLPTETDRLIEIPHSPSSLNPSKQEINEEEAPLVIGKLPSQLGTDPLFLLAEPKNYLEERIRDFNKRLHKATGNKVSAALLFSADPSARRPSLSLLAAIDQTLFDNIKVPRGCLTCFPGWILSGLKIGSGLAGMISMGLFTPGFTNWGFHEIFNYEPYGPVSISFMVASAVLISDVAFLQFYDFMQKLSQGRKTFAEANSYELENNITPDFEPQVFPHSLKSKLLKRVIFPAFSCLYAGQVLALWFEIEKDFPKFAIPISIPLVIFYAKPYFEMLNTLWNKWYIWYNFASTYEVEENRRIILSSLAALEVQLRNDTDLFLTEELWLLLNSVSMGRIVSKFACLLTKSFEIDEEVGEVVTLRNLILSRQQIQRPGLSDSLFKYAPSVVAALNIYPGFMMGSETFETLSKMIGLGETVSPYVGYGVGLTMCILLLVEARNFQNWLYKVTQPICSDVDHPFLRFFLRRKNNFFSLLNTAVFLADYYFAMSGESLKTIIFFMPFVFLRFYSFFDMISENLDNQAFTRQAVHNETGPSSTDKKVILLEYIRRGTNFIGQCTPSTIQAIMREAFNAQ